MTGFLFLRARGHRLLLAAALLAVLLTTAVLATLAAFAGSVGDAGLRHALSTRDAAAASLVITAQNPGPDRAAAARDAERGARQAYDGLPVSLRQFDRSGPYALPASLRPKAGRDGDPDLTAFADVDRSRVKLSKGAWPAARAGGGVVEAALPEAAAKKLGLAPGPKTVKLDDRLDGEPVRIRVTGVYRPADRSDPYWQLDELDGRGVRKESGFTTYGPLLVDPAVFRSDDISKGELAWVATADFRAFGADRIDALRASARDSQKAMSAQPALSSGVVAQTGLPETLSRLERALLVSRATLLIVSLQLVLLAGYALLMVARLLSTERESETRVLLARGASRSRIASLSALEALWLALPAAVAAPLLAGPLTGLLAGQGLLARIGLRIDTGMTGWVWLVGAVVALACALAVVTPALTAARSRPGRAKALPGPLRAGADLALLVVAGVAYWQLERRSSGSGALTGDREGELGIDPLLVVAPALALLAGTVLTLRLLPPAARFAERGAARGRGLIAPLAGWQFSRRPLRGAGPVLLLVLAVAMGMLAIGQGASWERSQDDQADFASGAPIRVLSGGSVRQFGQGGMYDGMPGVRAAAPAARVEMPLSGGRQATVLALDTALADGGLRIRDDLTEGGDGDGVLAAVKPKGATAKGARAGAAGAERAGVPLPADAVRLRADVTLETGKSSNPPYAPDPGDVDVTVTLEDRFGVPYRIRLGSLPQQGGRHSLELDLGKAADAPAGRAAGPLALTALEFDEGGFPERVTAKRFRVDGLWTVADGGASRPVVLGEGLEWKTKATSNIEPDVTNSGERPPRVTRVRSSAGTPLDIAYHTGTTVWDGWGLPRSVTVRAAVERVAPAMPTALATERFLSSSAAKTGSVIEVPMPGGPVRVRITGVLKHLPTTGPTAGAEGGAPAGARTASDAASRDGGALLVDLRAVNQVLATRPDSALPPTEWWLFPEAGESAAVAAALRDRADTDPGQIQVRDEIAAELHDDPLGAGPQSALLAVTVAAAALAAVGFAVAAVGTLRERSAEFAVLRALGAPRRRLARLLVIEQSLLIALALAIGVGIGAVLTRAVVPLIVLTGQAAQPVPAVLVELPLGRVALLLASVAAAPLLIVAALALRRGDPAAALRVQGGE